MFTLRCTSRLAKRLAPPLSAMSFEPTTRLGDWYANLLHIGRLQLVLALSERTFLPVVVHAAPSATLVSRLRLGVRDVLRAIGVATADVENEDAQMDVVAYGKTANRQVIGVLIDFAKALPFYVPHEPSLLALALRLADTPCSPLFKTSVSPDRAAAALFGVGPDRWGDARH